MCIMEFKLHSKYQPTGDQPQTIEKLVNSINAGNREQTLLGVTGSGKTFTMANVIQKVQRPTLVLAHNKTLAAQLCSEFKEFFPENAVEYFVSYYDYYQPEAYVAQTDTYIEKDSSINDEIDKLRHSATLALSERRDVIIVASVSCIYSLGDPIDYRNMVISLRPGMEKSRDELVKKLVELQYERNDVSFTRNKFRVRGDVVEIFPAASNDSIIRVEFFGDEIDRISEINPLTGELKAVLKHAAIYPASHYIVSGDKMKKALAEIDRELEERLAYFRENGKLLEAQRLEQRTRYDMEMLQEIGFCTGIENYSRIMSGRAPGSSPYTLIVNTSCNTSEGGSLCDIRHTRIVRIIIYKRRKTEVFEIFVSLFKSDCLGQSAYGANIHGVFDSIAYAGASDVFVIPVVYRLSAGVPVRLVFDRCCKSHAALV